MLPDMELEYSRKRVIRKWGGKPAPADTNHHEVLMRLKLTLPEQQQWLLRLREVEELFYEEIEEMVVLKR